MLIKEARASGARLAPACRVVGLDPRTVQRWMAADDGDDMRMGPKAKPANSLTKAEELEVLRVVNLPEFRDLPPKQIVPKLADMGRYVASESTIERILRREGQKEHRGPKKRKGVTKPREKSATAPCQVWTWDISVPQKAAREMRDRPLAIGLQEQVANHRKRLGSKALVVSVAEKAL